MTHVQRLLPWLALVIAIATLAAGWGRARDAAGLDYAVAGRIPICADGRVKPLDSFARNTLMSISGRQSVVMDGERAAPVRWWLELLTNPKNAAKREVFRIDHPDIVAILGLERSSRTRFSFDEIQPHLDEIIKQARMADATPAKQRDIYQRQVLQLYSRLATFFEASHLEAPLTRAPLAPGEEWGTLAGAVPTKDPNAHPSAKALSTILNAFADGNAAEFNTACAEYHRLAESVLRAEVSHADEEVLFNRFQPFYKSSILYVGAFVLACLAFLLRNLSTQGWSKSLGRATLAFLLVAFVVHTIGLIARIYIQGRPPVTNLYSSAVFIGWACIPIAMFAEWFYRLGLGALVSSLVGFATLVVAHNLSSGGDTMEMMQAVLDTNFWLATHVVVVTIGYSATFLAGFLGATYLTLGVVTRLLRGEPMKALPRMTYGVICFASITSFVGTVLGGIWADQSWGRFWGWDPKENGAALIVIMNLLTLHARWGGMIKERGVAVLAVLGNIVTAWSWFGTNMLGVGLHSYGFMDSAAFYLVLFCAFQLAIMCFGFVPVARWRSAGDTPPRQRVIIEAPPRGRTSPAS